MNDCALPKATRRAFTLVELLIVVAIIAVLIAILLPALGKARDAANTVACMSNMRQLTNLTMIYVNENRGWFPHCTNDGSSTPAPDRQDMTWTTYIANNTTATTTSPEQLCPVTTAMAYSSTLNRLIWQGQESGSSSAYEATPWITVNSTLATRDDQWQPTEPGPPSDCVKATRIQHPTQIMLVIDSDSNTFAGGYYPAEHLRWRHQFGRGINLAFMDGHVETWNYSQLTNPLLPVKPQNPYNLLLNSTSYLPWGETLVPN